MEKIIFKINPALLEINPIKEYLNQFKNYEIIHEDILCNNEKIVTILCNNEIITIAIDKFNCSIYRYHPNNGAKYEQIDVITYDTPQNTGEQNKQINKVIRYSNHIEDEIYSYIECSIFLLLDDKLIHGEKLTRTVPIEDLKEIQYNKNMNLTELAYMSEKNSSKIINSSKKKVKNISLKLRNTN